MGALLLLMAVVALGSYAALNFERLTFINPTPAIITVSGEGEVNVVPDVGSFSFSVNAEGKDAAEAQEESGTKINAILAYLKEQGIEDKDVKTQNYNLYPKWRYEERVCSGFNSYCPPGERVQDGFQVSQSVSVKVRDTDKAGNIIAGVGERGATNISSLNFSVDDVDALQAEARAAAITDAKAKAAILADQLNVRLVRIVSFNENGGGYYSPRSYEKSFMAMDAMEESFDGAELPVGENTTTETVSITYEIR